MITASKYWLRSVAVLLIFIAIGKIANIIVSNKEHYDAVFDFMPSRAVSLLAASVELAVAIILVRSNGSLLGWMAVFWLFVLFGVYRLGVNFMGDDRPCDCLGLITSIPVIGSYFGDGLSAVILLYFGAVSSFFVWVQPLAGKLHCRKLLKSERIAPVLLFFLSLNSAFSSEIITVDGTIGYTAWLPNGRILNEVREFELEFSDYQHWKIENTGQDGSIYQVSSDGTNVYSATQRGTRAPVQSPKELEMEIGDTNLTAILEKVHRHTDRGKTNSTARMKLAINQGVGLVEKGNVPQFAGDFAAPIYAAYLSGLLIKAAPRNEFPYLFGKFGLEKTNSFLPFEARLDEARPYVPAMLNYYTGNEPPDQRVLLGKYQALNTTNVDGFVMPKNSRFDCLEWTKDESGMAVKTNFSFLFTTREFQVEKRGFVASTVMAVPTLVEDRRFSMPKSVQYLSTNGHFKSENAILRSADYKSAKLSSEATLKQHQVAGWKQKLIGALLVLIFILPAAIWLRKVNRS